MAVTGKVSVDGQVIKGSNTNVQGVIHKLKFKEHKIEWKSLLKWYTLFNWNVNLSHPIPRPIWDINFNYCHGEVLLGTTGAIQAMHKWTVPHSCVATGQKNSKWVKMLKMLKMMRLKVLILFIFFINAQTDFWACSFFRLLFLCCLYMYIEISIFNF